jgi:hypothetical protein
MSPEPFVGRCRGRRVLCIEVFIPVVTPIVTALHDDPP